MKIRLASQVKNKAINFSVGSNSQMTSSPFFVVFLFFALFWASCLQVSSKKLTIATAANVQFAMEALLDAFEAATGIQAEMILGSSGKLTAQIKEGAPYDIFLSANMKYPQELVRSQVETSPPEVYALGTLVLWTVDTSLDLSLEGLKNLHYSKIAIANPRIAPYGEAALQLFKALGVDSLIEDRLVYGESIAQTNQFIISGAAEVGLTALSVVRSPSMKQAGQWIELPIDLYEPIQQGVVHIRGRSPFQEEARQFLQFLFSSEGQQILRKFGYLIPNE